MKRKPDILSCDTPYTAVHVLVNEGCGSVVAMLHTFGFLSCGWIDDERTAGSLRMWGCLVTPVGPVQAFPLPHARSRLL